MVNERKKQRQAVSWGKIILWAVGIFLVSLILGKLLGGALLGSSVAVKSNTSGNIDFPIAPSAPSGNIPQANRQDIVPPLLVLPPPVVPPKSSTANNEPPSQTPAPDIEENPPSSEKNQETKPATPLVTGNHETQKVKQSVSESYKVQLGSFTTPEFAEKLVHELLGKGYSGNIETISGTAGTYYRVYVGPYESKEEAEGMVKTLSVNGYPAILISKPH